MNFEEIFSLYKQHINPYLADLLRFAGCDKVEWEAEGCIVRDYEGNEYIDCLGGYGVFSLGHRHPKVVEAVEKQLQKMPLSSKVFLNPLQAKLGKRLSEIAPGDLQCVFFSNSGTEAVEASLKFARMFTGRKKFVSAVGSFHGKTLGSLSVSGRDIYKKPFEPLLPNCEQVPFGDVEALEKAIDDSTAALILEPIQGEGGVNVPPDDFLPRAREICDERGALLIIDEVQTGLGRCGKMFACELWGIVPDIMCLAKALGGGVMPIGATIARPHIWRIFQDNPLIHSSTFGGNPLACAAALATLDVIEEENLPQRAEKLGDYLLKELKSAKEKYPTLIRDIRGKGLLVGVEFSDEDIGLLTITFLLKRGVLVAYALNNPKVMRLEPPLIISEDILDKVIKAFYESLEDVAGVLSVN
ncbi:MAG: aspartate aminotransferase family protein [bacterium]